MDSSLNATEKIAVLVYVYYKSSVDFLIEELTHMKDMQTHFFFCFCNNGVSNQESIHRIQSAFPLAYVIQTPNKGKDIGPKLALIHLCLSINLKVDYYIFLHDKQSPHTSTGQVWRKKLFRIIEPASIQKIIELFKTNEKIGIVGAEEFIVNEYNHSTAVFTTSNNEILKTLLTQYKFPEINYDFVGGTMFWMRAAIVNEFFLKHDPLQIRATLETGNVLDHIKGTNTHAWERMFSWIAATFNYQVKGIK